MGWWSTVGEYGVGYVTGSLGGYEPADALESAVRAVLRLPPL